MKQKLEMLEKLAHDIISDSDYVKLSEGTQDLLEDITYKVPLEHLFIKDKEEEFNQLT